MNKRKEKVFCPLIEVGGLSLFLIVDYLNHPDWFQVPWIRLLAVVLCLSGVVLFLAPAPVRLKSRIWLGFAIGLAIIHAVLGPRSTSNITLTGFQMILLATVLYQFAINLRFRALC